MQPQNPSEAGHASLLIATLLAGIALIVLALGTVRSNPTLAWVGGIGAAVLFLVQAQVLHLEIRSLLQRIDQLEEEQE